MADTVSAGEQSSGCKRRWEKATVNLFCTHFQYPYTVPGKAFQFPMGLRHWDPFLTIIIQLGLHLLLTGVFGAHFCVGAPFLSFKRENLDKHSAESFAPEVIYTTNSSPCARKGQHPTSHTDYLFLYLKNC